MNQERPLKIGISEFKPFVILKEGRAEGFEIDLWERVARDAGMRFEYEPMRFQELLPALKMKEIDVAIAGLTLTEDREKEFDFSRGTFNSGLRIMVPSEAHFSVWQSVKAFFTRKFLDMILVLVGFVAVAANLIWLAERTGGGALSGPYIPGVFNAVWWVFETVSTIGYGDYIPVTAAGRAVATLVILIGLAIFGLYVGQVSSLFTVKRLRSAINSENDLRGRKTATVAHSACESYLREIGADVAAFPRIEDAYDALSNSAAEAVVFDDPVLACYAKNEGGGKVALVGDMFKKQNYAFALQEGSPFEERVNQAILKLYDSGEYAELYKKWFGEAY